jgi:F0F1-type ATP synthase gamma subunit
MRGELIRVLSSVEEKANGLKLDGYEPDVVLVGRKAYEFIKEQVNEEFGGKEEVCLLYTSPSPRDS